MAYQKIAPVANAPQSPASAPHRIVASQRDIASIGITIDRPKNDCPRDRYSMAKP